MVSRSIIPYEQARIGKTIEKRGSPAQSGPKLFKRFSGATDWVHNPGQGKNSTIITGDLLSGEKLIDDKMYRDELVRAYAPVVGGEMEGYGLAAAAHSESISEWIVVKGICDYADGNKGTDKKARQLKAALAAVSLCEHILQTVTIVLAPPTMTKSPTKETENLSDLFFVSYRPEVESFYLVRDFDSIVTQRLIQGNVWIWGKSGVGKTVALQRSAIQLGMKCVFVDLSCASNTDAKTLLQDAFWALVDYFEPDFKPKATGGRGAEYWIRAIASLISRNITENTVVIVDEFSLESEREIDVFVNYAISLIIRLTNLPGSHRLHLAFASVYKPIEPGSAIYRKLIERVPLIEMTEWSTDEIISLAEIIEVNSDLPKVESELPKLEIKIPRTLKTLLRLHLHESADNPQQTLLETARKHHDEIS